MRHPAALPRTAVERLTQAALDGCCHTVRRRSVAPPSAKASSPDPVITTMSMMRPRLTPVASVILFIPSTA
jgi:hypothetical protein